MSPTNLKKLVVGGAVGLVALVAVLGISTGTSAADLTVYKSPT